MAYSLHDFVEQAQDVPVQMPGGTHGVVTEAMNLTHAEAFAIEAAGENLTPAGPKIDCQRGHFAAPRDVPFGPRTLNTLPPVLTAGHYQLRIMPLPSRACRGSG